MEDLTFKPHRLNDKDRYYDKERQYLNNFCNGVGKGQGIDLIVFRHRDGVGAVPIEFLTEREKKIALSVIQWLGTPVGQGFLQEQQSKKDE